MSVQASIALAVFLITYAAIVSEKIHRTVIALSGALLLLYLGILDQETAISAIDFNTLGLLIGMMVIVGIARHTGIFEYLAVRAAQSAHGKPMGILVNLAGITALLSAFLDNVTTVLLVVPITFSIAERLRISPMPFLFAEILASNIGGTATLIGDPPNIMIGSATGLGFVDFLTALAPVVLVVHFATIAGLCLYYRTRLHSDHGLQAQIMVLDAAAEIRNVRLLGKCLAVIGTTIAGFMLHQFVHIESGTIALSGAVLLLLITKADPEEAFEAVEWSVIFFFIGLFVIVGGLEATGVIEMAARRALEVTGGNLALSTSLILWLSAIASAFVDNIPFTATMIPLIQDMSNIGGMTEITPLWWALALGACLGGNGTLIGASANIVVASMAEKRGVQFNFIGFLKLAFPLMIGSIGIAHIYLFLRYL